MRNTAHAHPSRLFPRRPERKHQKRHALAGRDHATGDQPADRARSSQAQAITSQGGQDHATARYSGEAELHAEGQQGSEG